MSSLRIQFNRTFSGGPGVSASLEIPLAPARVTVLFGPSGSGKTTLLRVLAGLDRAATGEIRFGAACWVDSVRRVFVPPQARRVGFLFQDYALFPHLNVADNIGYGLAGLPAEARRARAEDLLARFHLETLRERRVAHLSGGEKQRVALARTLAPEPGLLLLDEPLSALDAPTRERLRGELRVRLQAAGIPAIVVTHDRTEALALGDDLVVMSAGRIVQQGAIDEVFRRPASPEVARIVGVETVQAGRVVAREGGLVTVEAGTARLFAAGEELPATVDDVLVSIRAEDVVLLKDGVYAVTSARNRLAATVRALVREGAMYRAELDCGFPLVALVTRQAVEELALAPGAAVAALIKAPHVHLIVR